MRRRDTLPRPWNTTLLAAVAEWTRLAEWNLKKNLHSEARRCRERAQGIMAEYLGAKTPEQRKRDRWR